jgi:deoxyribodipyrimidine photo-lyase
MGVKMDAAPVIVWFRRDLRIADNPALSGAAAQGRPVIPLYVQGWEDGDRWAPGIAGRWWLGRSVRILAASLAERGMPLRIAVGPAEEQIPRLAREAGASEVLWNRLYEPYARQTDAKVVAALQRDGVRWRAYNAALLFEPEDHLARSGKPFGQFTAFWRSCLSQPEPDEPGPGAFHPGPAGRHAAESASAAVRAEDGRQEEGTFGSAGAPAAPWEPEAGDAALAWEPGEDGALARLQRFLAEPLSGYDASRDIPAINGTSRLSPHLHFGEIGPRQVWHAVRAAAREAAWTQGADTFLRQLGWREFAQYLLFHFPHIAEEPFRPEFARFPWEDDPVGLEMWRRGATGYPLVDAGMRQLLAEGWMHNRVRMVSASLLTKDLLIPWQQGAAWFWDRLVDADLANNSLGWQWTAGSGPDGAPYFRVFNPLLQARRFDPAGEYVRTWALEGYPPIVDHGEARARALAAFRGIRRT